MQYFFNDLSKYSDKDSTVDLSIIYANNGIEIKPKDNVNYSIIDNDGLPKINTYIHAEDVVIGMVTV